MLPDTYMNMGKGHWAKGVAFINGFNLVRKHFPVDLNPVPYPELINSFDPLARYGGNPKRWR